MTTSKNDVAYIKLSKIHNALKENKPVLIKSVYLDWGVSEKNSIYKELIKLDNTNYSYLIENILQNGGDINYQIPADSLVKLHETDFLGYTALHFAVVTNSVSGLHSLLVAGSDFTIKNLNDFTALRLAVEHSFGKSRRCLDLKGTLRHPLVDLILDAHVTTRNPSNPKCKNGISHFHIACMTNNIKAVELFLSSGVDANEIVNLDSQVVPGYTALHFAARYCSLETLRLLLKYGADRHPKNSKKITPLHILIEYKMEIFEATKAQKLFDYKWLQTDLNMIENMIELLISNVENMDEAIDDIGLTRFHIVNNTVNDNIEETKKRDLCDDLKVVSQFSRTEPCVKLAENIDHSTSDSDTSNVVIKEHGPNPNNDSKNLKKLKNKLRTPDLLKGTEIDKVNNIDVVIVLDSPVWPGYTPLHFAAHFNPCNFSRLCTFKADMSIKDKRGLTPFDLYLENYGRENLCQILSSYDNLKNIRLSDGTKLVDVISGFADNILPSDVNAYVQLDSPLWAGYTLLHLAVTCVKKTSDDKIFRKVDHSCDPEDRRGCFSNEKKDIIIHECLKRGVDSTIADVNGMTPLHLALRQEKQQVIYQILNYRPRKLFNAVDRDNLSHFHIAVCANKSESISNFLQFGVDVNSSINSGFIWRLTDDRKITIAAGSTALHIAVATESIEATILLLSQDVNPCIKNSDGLTPLHLAFIQNSRSLMQLLTSTSRVLKENTVAKSGLSDFHIACHIGDSNAVESHLKSNVEVNSCINCKLTDTYAENPDAEKSPDFYTSEHASTDQFLILAPYAGFTALHFAVQSKSLEVIELLVQHGADINAKNQIGLTPLYLALITHHYVKVKNYFLKLLRNSNNDGICEIGFTPLHLACMRPNKQEVENILKSNVVDVNARINEDSPIFPDYTPLHLLTDLDHGDDCGDVDEVAELLLNYGADVTTFANDQTPLHCAYDSLYSNLQKILLRNQKVYNVNPINYEGFSHFHIACTKDDPTVVEEFLKNGTDVNLATDHFLDAVAGYTPLHFAVINSCATVIDVLIKYGADVNARDSYGSTPLHVAMEGHDVKLENIMKILSTGKADTNARNVCGKTPLEALVTWSSATAQRKELEHYCAYLFLTNGALVNVYNPVNSEGSLALLFRGSMKITKLFNLVMELATDLDKLDRDTGNNAVHNIVSLRSFCEGDIRYAYAIENLLEKKCSLDHRNLKGETPLHTAIRYENKSAIVGLLMLGADINIADLEGNVPFSCCNVTSDFAVEASKEFAWHVHKLIMFDLYVNAVNQSLYDKAGKASAAFDDRRNEKLCLLELERVKRTKIKDRSVPIHVFLTEQGVAAFPTMPLSVREEILEFFISEKPLFQSYVHLGGLLLLQFRKAQERVCMMKDAKAALMILADCGLPDPCTEGILRNLVNEDLKCIITVKEEFENPSKRQKFTDEL